VVRMVHGFPGRVDRIRGLGNAVVPQVAEWLGQQIVRHFS
jgi:DNA (cytosine-5)-methyltransferase 1